MANIPQQTEQPEAMKVIFLDNVPESLHRRVKATSAEKGQTLKAFVVEVLYRALSIDKQSAEEQETHES